MVGRDDQGKFTKGYAGGPGRPKKEREEKYYEILVTACTPADWKAICKKAVEQAKKGDATARKFLADYLIGPPVERKEFTGADGGMIIVSLVSEDETA